MLDKQRFDANKWDSAQSVDEKNEKEQLSNDLKEQLIHASGYEGLEEEKPLKHGKRKAFLNKKTIIIISLVFFVFLVVLGVLLMHFNRAKVTVSTTTETSVTTTTYSTNAFEKTSDITKTITQQKPNNKAKSRSKSSGNGYSKSNKSANSAVKDSTSTESFEQDETTSQQNSIINHCTNNDNHSSKCGNIGMWFDSYDACVDYVYGITKKLATEYYNETGIPKSPVVRYWSCDYCGKWTANIDNY